MSFYSWTQELPIDAEAYAAIIARMGDAPMPGLVVHLAMEREDGSMHYLDVWESKESHDRAFAEVVHPAVGPVLAERGIRPAGEPPKTPIKVIDVRTASGSAGDARGVRPVGAQAVDPKDTNRRGVRWINAEAPGRGGPGHGHRPVGT